GDADAHHEVGHRLALAALAADRADAVALAVDTPPAEVHAPLRRNRRMSFAREPLDLGVGIPRIQRLLEPFSALRFRLFRRLAHLRLRSKAFTHPTYLSGTSTHALH